MISVVDTDNRGLIKKCGSVKPSKLISSGNKLTVKFHSDYSVNKKGFKAIWKQVTATEGGSIKSENYPQNYPDNKVQVKEKLFEYWCMETIKLFQEWSLSVAEGSKIQLTFETLDIEAHSTCVYDYVEVNNGGETKKFCGTTVPDPITSTANIMTVKFKSDYSVNKKGFSAVWKKV